MGIVNLNLAYRLSNASDYTKPISGLTTTCRFLRCRSRAESRLWGGPGGAFFQLGRWFVMIAGNFEEAAS